MTAREEIKNLIEKAVENLYGKKVEVKIEKPAEMTYGDYATNVAMTLKKNPQEIANVIKSTIIEKVEVKNGFVNFFVAKEYLRKQVGEILKQKEKFGELKIGKGQKVNVEFISANPTGELHLGHGRGAFFGDVLANILEKAGYNITREYFINDAKNSAQIQELGKTALGKGTTYLTEELKTQISKLKNRASIYGSEGEEENGVLFASQISKLSEGEAGYKLAQIVQKDIRNFIEKKLKIKFDSWVSEEELYKKSKIDKIYNWLGKRDLIYQKENAQWLKTSEYGDTKDWVVIRETGEPTYLLSDTAYHKDKFDRGFSKIINIWGADHQGHVGKIKAVAKILNYKGDLDILISQVVRLKGGKISKRKGQIITLDWLINEAGLDAARFFYLMKSLDTQMEFDLELAKERSAKSPVYYIQYAHARICSILRKTKIKKRNKFTFVNSLQHPSELGLIKQLIRFPEIIEDTAKDYQVQRLPQYAVDLATSFHQFYRDCQVLTENSSLRVARIGLILATRIVFKNTLNLMGISAPEKM